MTHNFGSFIQLSKKTDFSLIKFSFHFIISQKSIKETFYNLNTIQMITPCDKCQFLFN